MLNEIRYNYLQYLIWKCGLEKMSQYSRLFEILHDIDFEYCIDRDGNRYDDGVEMRDDMDLDEYDESAVEDFMDYPCSVFEMLVALSIRIENEYIGDPAEPHPEHIFMEMIKNLGLDRFKNGYRNYRDSEIEKVVLKWMLRKFDRNGKGSPFPVKYDHRDQRELEIWDQINNYVSENYG